mmetsp:Transcript_8137/g.26690  ORF Transcript_8137/g.26690 Transcript_8137/m.26690 type:complete len:207 (+) Transcript_8137:186-806(+)
MEYKRLPLGGARPPRVRAGRVPKRLALAPGALERRAIRRSFKIRFGRRRGPRRLKRAQGPAAADVRFTMLCEARGLAFRRRPRRGAVAPGTRVRRPCQSRHHRRLENRPIPNRRRRKRRLRHAARHEDARDAPEARRQEGKRRLCARRRGPRPAAQRQGRRTRAQRQGAGALRHNCNVIRTDVAGPRFFVFPTFRGRASLGSSRNS